MNDFGCHNVIDCSEIEMAWRLSEAGLPTVASVGKVLLCKSADARSPATNHYLSELFRSSELAPGLAGWGFDTAPAQKFPKPRISKFIHFAPE